MPERRRFIRWQIDRQAKVKLPSQDSDIDCHIQDISYKGAKICLTSQLEKDTYIALTIALSGDCILKLEVWVAWHKTLDGHNVYGVYFSKISDGDKEKIYQFIRGNFPKEINKQWWGDFPREKGGEEMEDRRIFARFPAELSLRFLDLKENKEGQATVEDISAKGIGMVTAENLAPHTPLEMWLDIPNSSEPLYTRGEVVWSESKDLDNYRAGINLEKADFMGLSRVLRTANV